MASGWVGGKTRGGPRPFEAQGKQSAAAAGGEDLINVRWSDLADSFRPALIRRAKAQRLHRIKSGYFGLRLAAAGLE